MARLSLILVLLSLSSASGQLFCTPNQCPSQSTFALRAVDRTSSLANYFYIGSVLGVHRAGSSSRRCGPLQPSAIQNLEAFLWAVSTFKSRYNKLQNAEIGAIVFDSCMQSSRAIQQVMNLESGEVSYGTPALEPARVLAWVGADSDEQAVQLEPVLKSFSKTLVSHAASGPQLSQGFSNLLRTVPSQTHQVHAVAELLRIKGWRYIQLVYTDDKVGMQSYDLLMSLLSSNESTPCISNMVKLPQQNIDQDAKNAVEQLMMHSKTRVVVLLTNSEAARRLIMAAKDLKARGKFTWIGTTSWGHEETVAQGLETSAEGAVTFDHEEGSEFLEMFKQFWSTKKPSSQDPNPWFEDYWQSQFSCSGANCNYNTQSLADVPLDKYVPYMIKAVDAVLNGIANASKSQCGSDQKLCDDFMSYNGKWDIIRNKILDISIPGVSFDASSGDTKMGNYSIYNFRSSDYDCTDHCYKKVGFYDSSRTGDKLVLTDTISSYDSKGSLDRNVTSMCSESPCLVCGELPTTIKTTTPIIVDDFENAAVIESPRRIRDSAWVYALIVLASIGLVFVVGLEVFLIAKVCDQRYGRNLHSMWLGQMLLLGVFLAYLTLFAFVPEPSRATCGIIRFGVGVSYALMFAVLLVKLMIILSSQSDVYLKNIFQVLMLFFAVIVQIAIAIQWLILRYPQAVYEPDYGWVCVEGYESHIQSLVYVMFLILLTTLISISTHGIVSNHREGMFIGLVGGFSIPVWVAWILLGMLNENKVFQDPSLAYGLFITATLVLSLMFIPKVRQINGMSSKGLYIEDEVVEYAPALVTKSPMPAGPGSVVMSPVGAGSIAGDTLVYANAPIVKEGSVVLLNGDYGGLTSGMLNGGVAYAEPMQAKPLHLHYDADPNALYLRHPGPPQNFRGPSAPGSVSSAPVGANSVRKKNARLLRITRDLTGSTYNTPISNPDTDQHYATSTRSVTSTKSGSVKGERSIQDLGYL